MVNIDKTFGVATLVPMGVRLIIFKALNNQTWKYVRSQSRTIYSLGMEWNLNISTFMSLISKKWTVTKLLYSKPFFLDQCIVILKNLIVTWGSNTVNTATAVAKMHAFATAAWINVTSYDWSLYCLQKYQKQMCMCSWSCQNISKSY